VKGVPPRIGSAIRSYWGKMLEDAGIAACTRVRVEGYEEATPSGLYSALTAFLVYSVISGNGGAEAIDVVEVARHGDNVSGEWPGVIDALRLASLSGGVIVYRNNEEYLKVSSGRLRGLHYRYSKRADRPRVHRSSVGAEVYSALIHLMGVSVVEAARGLAGGGDAWSTISRFLPIHLGVSEAVWGIRVGRGNCIASPGLPKVFEVVCYGV